jgi:hypothetical protein
MGANEHCELMAAICCRSSKARKPMNRLMEVDAAQDGDAVDLAPTSCLPGSASGSFY